MTIDASGSATLIIDAAILPSVTRRRRRRSGSRPISRRRRPDRCRGNRVRCRPGLGLPRRKPEAGFQDGALRPCQIRLIPVSASNTWRHF